MRRQGPEGTATPSAGPATAPAFCYRPPDRNAAGDAGIAVARPETTSLSMSCGTRTRRVRPGDPDGVHFLRSSLDPHLLGYCSTAYCGCCELLAACYSAALRQPAPRPSCVCSGLEPHCRTSRCARPQPAPSPRYCSLTSLLGTANCTYRYALRPVLLAAAPDHCGPPGPVVSPVAVLHNPGFGTPPPHRPAHCNCGTSPGSSCLPGPAISGYERNHNHTITQCLLQPT